MTQTDGCADSGVSYAMQLANDSYDWYRRAAINSRKTYRVSETIMLLLASAAIPTVAAVVSPLGNTIRPVNCGLSAVRPRARIR